MSPCSTAVFKPQSAPPVSRTLVKPRFSMPSISRAARAVIKVSGTASRKRILTSLNVTWTWLSISPGIMVRPPQSITSAVVGLDRLPRHLAHGLAFDQKLEPALKLADLGFKQLEIPEQKLGHCGPSCRTIGQRC